jgi:hypothetical protein
VERIPASGKIQGTPKSVLSSVLIYNGTSQGSGTVISKGDKHAAILTAAHIFEGKIGGNFWVYYADGTYTEATLMAHDPNKDLALACVNADTIIDYIPVAKDLPAGDITSVGYPNGQGPNYKRLKYNGQNKRLWNLGLLSGTTGEGESGSGDFIKDQLVSVNVMRNQYNSELYSRAHQDVVEFLNENKSILSDCGDWSIPSKVGNGPPFWKPSPNVPIHIPTVIKLEPRLKRPSEVQDN